MLVVGFMGSELAMETDPSKCKQCGKDGNGTLAPEAPCECKSDNVSIRLGPVPDSAFRPPSPRPGGGGEGASKDDQRGGSITIPSGNGGGTKYEIVSIREKHGEFRKAIPCMPIAVAVICCLFNVVIPGTGTLIAGLTVMCGCRTEHVTRRRAIGYNLLAALLQFIMAPIIVGWIWSVLWGITFVNVSVSKALQEPASDTSV